ncbi:MAG: ribonuclease P protein component 1 [Halobacteriaceae archaeon]
MPVTPENLVRHELVGLDVEVVDSTDAERVGTAGRVVGETTRTLELCTDAGVTVVPKRGTTFEFALPDGESVVVEGRVLEARPARRTEQEVDSTWR